MKNWIRRMGVVSFFALSTFTFSSLAGPSAAQAAIGSVAWPLFPLMIVGAALEVTGTATAVAALVEDAQGFHYRARDLWGSSLAQILLGIVFLDDQNEMGDFQKVSPEQGQRYGLTQQELQAYNESVESGELELITQQASQELSQNSSHEQAKQVMKNLLSQLPEDAHRGFNKIAQHIIARK